MLANLKKWFTKNAILSIVTILVLVAVPTTMVGAKNGSGNNNNDNNTAKQGDRVENTNKDNDALGIQGGFINMRRFLRAQGIHLNSNAAKKIDWDQDARGQGPLNDQDWGWDAVSNPEAFTRLMDNFIANNKSFANRNCNLQVAYATLVITYNNFVNSNFTPADYGSRRFRLRANAFHAALVQWNEAVNGSVTNLCTGLAATGSTATATAVVTSTVPAAATSVVTPTVAATAVVTPTVAPTTVVTPTATAVVTSTAAMTSTAVVSGTAQGAGVIVTNNATLGNILTDTNGRTLYIFLNDKPGQDTCTGSCASIWQALVVPAGVTPTAGSGVTGTVGTITLPDGRYQITIDNMPLYYFAADKASGDTNGEGKANVWYAVNPAGAPINAQGTPVATPTTSP